MAGASPSANDLLPDKIGSWTTRTDTVYTAENLYDYIDGGAELYISYGFREVMSRVYSAGNQPDIIVDIFDMNTSSDAYGVFMYSGGETERLVGQGTQHNEGSMLFWMDHYFVSIMAYPETPGSKEALLSLGKTIASNIGKEGEPPAILRYLPEEGLSESSIRYFHHYAWLNSYYYIAGDNILLIDDNSRAVLAKYGDPAHRTILLIVEYPDAERASAAAGEFAGQYLPELERTRSAQAQDGTYAGMYREGPVLIVVFKAPTKAEADGMICRAREQIERTNQ